MTSCKSKKLHSGTPFHREHAPQSFMLVKPMFSDTVLYVKSYILRRVRKLSRVVEHRFECVYWKFGDKHGVVC